MQYVLMDLEWNGSYSKRAHGYFNEIIEIGATKLDENLQKIDRFHYMIKPVVSKKITHLVTDLTGIEAATLEDGGTFEEAMAALKAFVPQDAVVLTWSNTDLMVLIENCRFFFKRERIPFLRFYADAQAYCQPRIAPDVPAGQQMGLAKAGEMLGISQEGLEAHRAVDDSELTARIFAATFDKPSFDTFFKRADENFYKRLLYKPHFIAHVGNPLVKPEYLTFECPACGRTLKAKSKWRYSGRMLCADMPCSCGKKYVGRVLIKVLYDDVAVKRKLTEAQPKEETEPAEAE